MTSIVERLNHLVAVEKQLGSPIALPEPALDTVAQAASLITEAIEALTPFAKAYEDQGDNAWVEDKMSLWEHPAAFEVTVGNLRDARKALANLKGEA